eukprot:TRINITY_DN23025_c0_g1_i4.p1 TRINITY_DN23025_c0_g1~~TRINITY_DN23025_c0_g1_i4.p1  ORF type:complete len:103 (-),score=13.86 TRINITY_DN23025_c0_g1_i4:11-319(-)
MKAFGRCGRSLQDKRRTMEPNKRGRWSAVEDEKLVQIINDTYPEDSPPRHGVQWKPIAKTMDRSERSCREHYSQVLYPQLISEIGRAVQQECRDRSRMPSSA